MASDADGFGRISGFYLFRQVGVPLASLKQISSKRFRLDFSQTFTAFWPYCTESGQNCLTPSRPTRFTRCRFFFCCLSFFFLMFTGHTSRSLSHFAFLLIISFWGVICFSEMFMVRWGQTGPTAPNPSHCNCFIVFSFSQFLLFAPLFVPLFV